MRYCLFDEFIKSQTQYILFFVILLLFLPSFCWSPTSLYSLTPSSSSSSSNSSLTSSSSSSSFFFQSSSSSCTILRFYIIVHMYACLYFNIFTCIFTILQTCFHGLMCLVYCQLLVFYSQIQHKPLMFKFCQPNAEFI